MKSLKDFIKKFFPIRKKTKVVEPDKNDVNATKDRKEQSEIVKIPHKYNISENIWTAIYYGMKLGYLKVVDNSGNMNKYGVSRENIFNIIDPDVVDKQTLEKVIKELEDNGIKFKFETNDEWKKVRLKDPEKQ